MLADVEEEFSNVTNMKLSLDETIEQVWKESELLVIWVVLMYLMILLGFVLHE